MKRALRTSLLAALALAAGAAAASAQFSPGPLSAAHADLDATTRCFACHARGGGKAMDHKCLDCHGEIAGLRAARRGLHARDASGACATCHPEHAGRDFALVPWSDAERAAFDHRDAGWALEGRHAAVRCADCHRAALQKDPLAAKIRRKNRAASLVGLSTACASCHADPHRAELGADCARCHDAGAWKPARGFDHARTDYPLAGRHAQAACASCHAAEPIVAAAAAAGGPPLARDARGAIVPRWKGLPRADCAPCHRDPHAGRFPGRCASCHRVEGFSSVIAAGFDHDRTRYPLRGRHRGVECARCHDPKTAWGKKPAFAACGDCHRDAHAGQATLAGKPADCAACHAVTGFERSTFTAAAHAATRYPLLGAHARADCSACHARRAGAERTLGPARVALRPVAARCEDCHADPHAGRFAAGGARPRAGGCLACHGMEAFAPSGFGIAAHAASGFPLEGAHRAAPCSGCHEGLRAAPAASSRAGAPVRALGFEVVKRACADCHRSPHGGQFAARRDRGACDGCHGTDAFVPASRFDHARDAAFRLEGAHARARCSACHAAARDASGEARVVYRPLPTRCRGCHLEADPGPRRSAAAAAHVPGEVLHAVLR
uniref:Cytochrome c7-like domain-containing protein n=1 Tax=Eiseniibacteriota bacterium TaxID=2212470 RepID=A0A832I8V6_UNCEI